jgi:2,4-dienoyl-CoA reductase-like NADH-dependent reductase (Old Yellow Enzyme family)
MAELFEETSIHGMKLANRFVRSATWEGLADEDGQVTPALSAAVGELAQGEVGLIISSYTFVSPVGWAGLRQVAAYDDRFLPGLREMAATVHAAGGKIALQIAHGGCFSLPELSGLQPVGPSALEKDGHAICREASAQDIAEMVAAFTGAALRAKQAGFDAVQIHAAHGYLLSQFLSPAYNKRTDAYGGALQNRARLLLEIVQSIRSAVGNDYPLLVKLNSEDFLEGGLSRQDSIEVAVMLERASVNAVELSGGTLDSKKLSPVRRGLLKSREEEGYFREAAAQFKKRLGIPVMLVGGIRSYEVAEELLKSGAADYISLSRPLICEPGLVSRWHKGERKAATCISCNSCFVPGMEGRGVHCAALAPK